MSLEIVPFEIFSSIFKIKHYILLFDVSKDFRSKVCKFLPNDRSKFVYYPEWAIELNAIGFSKWWKYKQFPMKFYMSFPHYFITYFNSLDMLEWIYNNTELTPDDYHDIYARAIILKSIPMLDWIYARDIYSHITMDPYLCHLSDDDETSRWLLDHHAIQKNQK